MFLKSRVSHQTMKSKTFGALFGLLTIVAIIGVTPAFGQVGATGSIIGGKIGYKAQASDGTTVLVITAAPISGQPLVLGIGFKDSTGNFVKHQNYAITVTQDNNTVLSVPYGHTHTGTDTQTTSRLSSTDQISIQVTLNGVGLPTADPSTWTGVKGEVLSFSQVTPTTPAVPMSNMTNATAPGNQSGIPLGPPYAAGNATVPEFGPVASIVLAIAVLSVVVFAAKTRVIPRL